jgi:hypothetical protein
MIILCCFLTPLNRNSNILFPKLNQGFKFSAALRVFINNEAMVMGPTPPGTGVMYEAFAATSLNSTSPFKE